jgi:glycine betaine/proline transport system permease protein
LPWNAFVYLIPVIAFFGTSKPPGIIATLERVRL